MAGGKWYANLQILGEDWEIESFNIEQDRGR